jgi:hypothetical protein
LHVVLTFARPVGQHTVEMYFDSDMEDDNADHFKWRRRLYPHRDPVIRASVPRSLRRLRERGVLAIGTGGNHNYWPGYLLTQGRHPAAVPGGARLAVRVG